MSDWNIQLKASGFNSWLEFMEQSITRVKDQLVILESEEKQLSGIWKSGAKEQWEQGFFRELENVENSVAGMWEVITAAQRAAEQLAQMEKNMSLKAQML